MRRKTIKRTIKRSSPKVRDIIEVEQIDGKIEIDAEKEARREFLLDLQRTLEVERITRASDIEIKLADLDR